MKVTKYVHSCLLVETAGRTALFDPGNLSETALQIESLGRLDDIFISHSHGDHYSPKLVKAAVSRFPGVRITSTPEVVKMLNNEGLKASHQPPDGVSFFDSPHESVEPLFPHPEEIGVHYLEKFSFPGDSHSFRETKPILALPVIAPWGSTIKALNLALQLKPKHVIPIHDWHYSDIARGQMYDRLEQQMGKQGITFHKLQTGQPVEAEA